MVKIYPIEFINSLEPKYHLSKIDNDNFLNFYNKYLELDNIKPLFISKTINKFKKINNLNEEIWKITVVNDNIELFQKNIKIILNKLSENNSNILFESIICEIKKNASFEVINIIIKEIINKIIFDKKFHNIYAKLIVFLNDANIFTNFITIVENNNEFYWYFNTNNEKKLFGPYSNQKILEDFIVSKCKFINLFIDNLENVFNKYLDTEKNYTISILDFIFKLYENKMIDQKIIHQILLKFIYFFDDDFDEKYISYFIYFFDILIKNNFFNNKLLSEYITYINKLITNNLINNSRNKILIENIIDTSNVNIYDETDEDIEKILSKLNSSNQTYVIDKLSSLTHDKNLIIKNLIKYILNKNKKEYENYIKFIKKCQFITSDDLKINIVSFVHNSLLNEQKPNMITLISLINYGHQYDNVLLELI